MKNNCLSNQLSLLSSAGPRSPFTPESVTVSAVSSTSATIGWTVSSIAYTPETYVVEYGTSQDRLDMSSDPQYSGPKINIGSRTYSVQLNGLSAGTLYHYQVVANNLKQTSLSVAGKFTTIPLGMLITLRLKPL